MSFFKNLIKNGAGELHDQAVAGITNLAPDIAIQSEIDSATEALNALIDTRTRARRDLANDEQALDALTQQLTDWKNAGSRLMNRLKASEDPAEQADIKGAMNELTDKITKTNADITAATHRRDQSKAYCAQQDTLINDKQEKVQKLRQTLSDLIKEGQQLAQDKQRLQERAADQKAAAGLSRTPSASATSALERRNQRMRDDNAKLEGRNEVYENMANSGKPSSVLEEALHPENHDDADPEAKLRAAMGL